MNTCLIGLDQPYRGRAGESSRGKGFNNTAISIKVVGKSARDNPEKYCGWFIVHCFSNKFQRMAREAMDVCLRVLKESNKSRFDSSVGQEQCIDHIPYYLSGLSRAHFLRQPFSKSLYIFGNFPSVIPWPSGNDMARCVEGPEFDQRQNLFLFCSFLFLFVEFSFQLLQFCFVSLYSLKFLDLYIFFFIALSCRSP